VSRSIHSARADVAAPETAAWRRPDSSPPRAGAPTPPVAIVNGVLPRCSPTAMLPAHHDTGNRCAFARASQPLR
jgi:hypothetical protein